VEFLHGAAAVEQLPTYKRMKPNRAGLCIQIVLAPIFICWSFGFIARTHDVLGDRFAWFASVFLLVVAAYPIPFFAWMIARFRRDGSVPRETRIIWACLVVALIKLCLLLSLISTFWIIRPNLFAA
jgi:hypothetical protein